MMIMMMMMMMMIVLKPFYNYENDCYYQYGSLSRD